MSDSIKWNISASKSFEDFALSISKGSITNNEIDKYVIKSYMQEDKVLIKGDNRIMLSLETPTKLIKVEFKKKCADEEIVPEVSPQNSSGRRSRPCEHCYATIFKKDAAVYCTKCSLAYYCSSLCMESDRELHKNKCPSFKRMKPSSSPSPKSNILVKRSSQLEDTLKRMNSGGSFKMMDITTNSEYNSVKVKEEVKQSLKQSSDIGCNFCGQSIEEKTYLKCAACTKKYCTPKCQEKDLRFHTKVCKGAAQAKPKRDPHF